MDQFKEIPLFVMKEVLTFTARATCNPVVATLRILTSINQRNEHHLCRENRLVTRMTNNQ